MYRAKIYINFKIGVTLYFGAVRKCAKEIFYLKKFLLACGALGSLAILRCETCVLIKKLRMKMEKVLVSACLLGSPVRYDGIASNFKDETLTHWLGQGRLVSICPEVAGGLPVPRPRAEIINGNGSLVLKGRTGVIDVNGQNVTNYFLAGAHKALELARFHDIKLAVFKEGSPSCGTGYIHDGSFSGIKKPGKGVAAALLEKNGIRVFSERKISEAKEFLKHL